MKKRTLEEYLALPWEPVIDTVKDGDDIYVRLTVPGLSDFAVYGDGITEVRDRWREALASHLEGYLTVGKAIPEPPSVGDVLTSSADSTASNAQANTVLPRRRLVAA